MEVYRAFAAKSKSRRTTKNNKFARGSECHILFEPNGVSVALPATALSSLADRLRLLLKFEIAFDRLPEPIKKNLGKIIGDGGYRYDSLKELVGKYGIEMQVLIYKKLGENLKPKRWIVERTFAWYNHFRRLSRDYEKTCFSSETSLFISQIQLLLRRFTIYFITFQTPTFG